MHEIASFATSQRIQKFFSLLAIALLFVELFSPYAFAASTPTPTPTPTPRAGATSTATPTPVPSPTPKPTSTIRYPSDFSSSGGSCIVSKISDAERQTLWENTLNKPITELSDVPLEQALQAQKN